MSGSDCYEASDIVSGICRMTAVRMSLHQENLMIDRVILVPN